MLICSEGVLDTGLAERMIQWRHSGFSVHNRIRSKAADAKGRQRLARYMIRRHDGEAGIQHTFGTNQHFGS